jgi:hypothetical protein
LNDKSLSDQKRELVNKFFTEKQDLIKRFTHEREDSEIKLSQNFKKILDITEIKYQNEINELKEHIWSLARERESLKLKVESYDKEKEELSDINKDLTKKLSIENKRIDEAVVQSSNNLLIKTENINPFTDNDLEEEIKVWEDRLMVLQSENSELTSSVVELTKENAGLYLTAKQLKKVISECKHQISRACKSVEKNDEIHDKETINLLIAKDALITKQIEKNQQLSLEIIKLENLVNLSRNENSVLRSDSLTKDLRIEELEKKLQESASFVRKANVLSDYNIKNFESDLNSGKFDKKVLTSKFKGELNAKKIKLEKILLRIRLLEMSKENASLDLLLKNAVKNSKENTPDTKIN